jgi:hypothetical protein
MAIPDSYKDRRSPEGEGLSAIYRMTSVVAERLALRLRKVL